MAVVEEVHGERVEGALLLGGEAAEMGRVLPRDTRLVPPVNLEQQHICGDVHEAALDGHAFGLVQVVQDAELEGAQDALLGGHAGHQRHGPAAHEEEPRPHPVGVLPEPLQCGLVRRGAEQRSEIDIAEGGAHLGCAEGK